MDTPAAILAKKLAYLLDERIIVAAALARACGVSKQAITGWRRTGRIAKPHLQVIAEMANVSLEWLLDGNPPASETVTQFRPPRPTWPFKSVSWERYFALSADDKADLDRRISAIVTGYEASGDDGRKSPPTSLAS